MTSVSRRTFLLGGASVVALAACGGNDHSESSSDQTVSSSTTAGGLAIAKVFSPEQPVGVPVRLPLALADAQGALLDGVPARIKVRYGPDAGELSTPLDVTRHAQGIPRPYFPLVATFTSPGTWRIQVEVNGATADATVTAKPHEQLPAVPGIGDKLISMKTPTKSDALGVDPICTRQPPCPFHEKSLDEAMKSGNAIAFIVSTPAFCQTAICGPVLDLVVDRAKDLSATVEFVHAEVYTDDTAKTTTDAVQTYGLTYEPALFLALPDGTIQGTLAYTFDGVELDAELSRIVQ
ncbi:MAG: hypothetical protein V7636_274 [Actinomycetota bacterium]